MRVAFLTNAPAPYRFSFYEEWAKLDELVVVYDQTSSDRAWTVNLKERRFRFLSLNSRSVIVNLVQDDLKFSEKRNLYFSFGVFRLLCREKPETVVSAEFGIRTFLAALYSKLHKVPLYIANEGTPHTERLIRWPRKLWRKLLIKLASGFWTNGRDSSQFLIDYGVDSSRISTGMTGVDTHYFRAKVAARITARAQLRESYGLKGTAFLILGSLSGRKGILELRAAVDAYLSQHPDAELSLIFLGNGPLMEETQAWAKNLPTKVRTIFPGFVQIDGVPDYMVAADWGLMPTLEDCWPLSTLEMLLAGLPQLFSIYNGGTAELCREGKTGFAFDPVKPGDFAHALQRAITAPSVRLTEDIIQEFSEHYSPAAQASRAHESLLKFCTKN